MESNLILLFRILKLLKASKCLWI